MSLGDWLHCEDGWEWFFSPSQECLFKLDQGTWLSFSQVDKRDKLPVFSSSETTAKPPPDKRRATIYFREHQIICTGFSPIAQNLNTQATSFVQFLHLSDPGERWCFSHLDLGDDGVTLAIAIREGDAITISDGSFQDQYGTAAWVLEGKCSMGRIVWAVMAPGMAKGQSAYRSELTGIYCILICAKKLCEFYNITQGSIELSCDGLSALDNVFNFVSVIKIEDSNYDLLFAPLTWKFRHVKGHQDDHSSHDQLDRWAKLNVEMDSRAKRHIEIAKRSPRHYMIANEPWSIWYEEKKIISDLTETIYDLVHSEEAKVYWKQKDNLKGTDIDSINWDLTGAAMQETKRPRRVFISKHASGMCGIGKFMKRWKLRQDDVCPRYRMPEDSTHALGQMRYGTRSSWT